MLKNSFRRLEVRLAFCSTIVLAYKFAAYSMASPPYFQFWANLVILS